jgi:2-keto-4-pentenoate hydratase/2-oxohepta-3-ene-1,7-dioic acid hydratase in catechol pathway
MGPWITTGIDPMKSMTRLKKNGKLEAEFTTGDMIFDATEYIVATARFILVM